MTEPDLIASIEAYAPDVACELAYCATADELRTLMNARTGLDIQPEDDADSAYRQWIEVLKGRVCIAS